ncbi:MAG: aminodeoxychorismate/anthranilate synthase component II [Endozoicomonadaceae bacterium]|nr:aminodeoxychorismate/anthranilate synthase component II [Endozoicomonadaceae bacterium]
MLVMIDNYDSFTYNLVQYFQELGETVRVFRHDAVTIEALSDLSMDYLVISPGPCSPNESGISMQAIDFFSKQLPVLGVCLGHQCLGQLFGGKIIRAAEVMHGKQSTIHHDASALFRNINNPFVVTRYHSLIIDRNTLPECLKITAWTENEHNQLDIIMAIEHQTLPLFGVQFHPESILTEHGHALLNNFLQQKTESRIS